MKQVLILGPQDIVSKSIASYCEQNDCEVDTIVSGADAFGLLFTKKFDLIITPMFLEKVDAVQIIKAVRNSDSLNTTTPKIMITSEKNVPILFGKDEGPDYVLPKDQDLLKSFELMFKQLFNAQTADKKMRVLYIDDDNLVRKMIELWLGKIPEIDVDICASLEEVKNLNTQKYDIIATDHILDDGNSEDIVAYLQGTINKDTPVLVYTATVGNVDFGKLQTIGNVHEVLPKPFKLKHFQHVLTNLK